MQNPREEAILQENTTQVLLRLIFFSLEKLWDLLRQEGEGGLVMLTFEVEFVLEILLQLEQFVSLFLILLLMLRV